MNKELPAESNQFLPVPELKDRWIVIRVGSCIFFSVIAFAFGSVSAIIIAVPLLVLAVMALYSGGPQLVRDYRKLSAPVRPVFVPEFGISDAACTAMLDGEQVVVLQLQSFTAKAGMERWIELLAEHVRRRVFIIRTTGVSHAYQEPDGTLGNVICIGLQKGDSAEHLAAKTKEFLELCGLEVKAVSESIFASAAGHNWWCTHFFWRRMQLTFPLAEQLESMNRLGPVEHTAIFSILVKRDLLVEVSAELLVFTLFKPIPLTASLRPGFRDFDFGPEITTPERLQNASLLFFNLELLAQGKLKVASAVPRRLLCFTHLFNWKQPLMLESPDGE